MHKINGNNKIVVPPEIVDRMGGHPGDEIVFVEELDPGDSTLKVSRTYRLQVMLKSVWDEECKKMAKGEDSFLAAKILDEEIKKASLLGEDILDGIHAKNLLNVSKEEEENFND